MPPAPWPFCVLRFENRHGVGEGEGTEQRGVMWGLTETLISREPRDLPAVFPRRQGAASCCSGHVSGCKC